MPEYGLFAVIKAIFRKRNDLDLIINYIQPFVLINKLIHKILKKYGGAIRTHNFSDSIKMIHPLCHDYLVVISKYLSYFKCHKIHALS